MLCCTCIVDEAGNISKTDAARNPGRSDLAFHQECCIDREVEQLQPTPFVFMPHSSRFPRIADLIHRGIEQKLHCGMQIYVSIAGDVVCDFAVGENRPGTPLSHETLMLWMSSGKPITVAGLLQLVEQDRIGLDDLVSKHIPEFSQKGKEEVTIRHLLTHTAGLKPIVSGWPHRDWDTIIDKICNAALQQDWVVGEDAGYDPSRSWFILGEIIKRVDGKPVDHFVRENILEPLGMVDCWMALPAHLYKAYDKKIGVMFGVKDSELHATHGHEKEVCQKASPGGSMRGPAKQLGLFYETLLNGGVAPNGTRILKAETVEHMTSRQRLDKFDQTFRHKMDFGLGLIVNSNRYGKDTVPYGFGIHAGEDAFGHGGAQSSIAFADPENKAVVVAIANGCPGEELHQQRFRTLLSTIYEELGLAKGA